jgi:hypothetical protein
MSLLPATWRGARRTLSLEGVVNVKEQGAAGDGVTNDSATFHAAIELLEDGNTFVIPGGVTYYLPDGPFEFDQSNITIKSDGAAVLDFGGGQGFHLTGTNQEDVTCTGLHFTDFIKTGFGVPDDGSQNDAVKRRIRVIGNKFTDCASSTGNVTCVSLQCRTQSCVVEGNYIENIVSTATASTPAVYGVICGRKGDVLSGGRTGEAWSYGYDGISINTSESGDRIAGNTIRNLRGSGAVGTDPVTAILVDGWRAHVSDNTIEDIRYVGADATIVSGAGIYLRGFNQVCYGNTIQDCTWAHVVYKDGSSSTNFGPLGKGVIFGNTFRGTALQTLGSPVQSQSVIAVNNGYVDIRGNVFDRIYVDSSGGNPYVIFNSSYHSDVVIEDNTFIECLAANIIGIAGSRQTVRGNRFIKPLGPETSSNRFVGVYYYGTGAAARDLVIEDNIFDIDDAALRANVGCRGVLLESVDHALHNVSIKNNKFNGFATAPTETWFFVYLNIGLNGHNTWVVENNTTDGGWRGASNTTMNYINVALDGATTYPVGFRWTWDFGGPLSRSSGTDSPLAADESGAHLTNASGGGTNTWALPASVPGMEFTFSRESANALRIDPNGTEVIGDGGAGKYLELTHYGTVHLVCNVAGRWTIKSVGAWNDPGAAGAPTPGWLWEA